MDLGEIYVSLGSPKKNINREIALLLPKPLKRQKNKLKIIDKYCIKLVYRRWRHLPRAEVDAVYLVLGLRQVGHRHVGGGRGGTAGPPTAVGHLRLNNQSIINQSVSYPAGKMIQYGMAVYCR